MRIIVIPVGSAGDVHPYVGVALALQQRGHHVRVITNPYFAPLLKRVGLPLTPAGTATDFKEVLAHPDIWNHMRGLSVIGGAVARSTAELYRLIQAEATEGDEVLVAPGLAFAARIAHETIGLPLVTMHLQPSCFISIHKSAVMHPWLASINRWPPILKRMVLRVADNIADRALSTGANTLLAELGLPMVQHIVSEWWHSPQSVIGLFPSWYGAIQPDWPQQTSLTGFPLYDEREITPIDPSLDVFLSESADRPVVFVPGSGNRQASQFFASAADACRRLGRRGLLLTRFPEQIPAPLPAGIHHADYAPLSEVLPRVEAVVHHGGIGTSAQALRCECPQLVMPMTFDQPDNAARLGQLGVSRTISPGVFTGKRVARELEKLLGSDDVSRACRNVAQRFEGIDPIMETCELIETTR